MQVRKRLKIWFCCLALLLAINLIVPIYLKSVGLNSKGALEDKLILNMSKHELEKSKSLVANKLDVSLDDVRTSWYKDGVHCVEVKLNNKL